MINDIALDSNGDLYFNDTGDMRLINGIDYVRQKTSIRLKWFLGEWYLNLLIGVPYYQKILIKNPNKLDIIGYLKRQILLTEGIEKLEKFNLEFVARRTISVKFMAITNYGKLQYNEIYTVN
jgi:hypothetical protein